MTNERRLGIIKVGKLFVTGAALTGFLLFTSAPRLHADEAP